MIATILLILALVSAIAAAFEVTVPRVHFGWLAVALWILSILLGGAHVLATV